MNGVDFIHKSLRSFHDQRRFDTVFVIVFYAQGIVFHFQHRIFLVGNLLEPGFVFGRIGNARFAHAPHFFQQRHADLRAETRRQTQRVFKVVMAAFAQGNAFQLGVGFLKIGNGRHDARVEAAHGNGVLQPRTHGVAGKAFGIADDNGADIFAEGGF